MSEDRNESNETSSVNTEIDTAKMDVQKQKTSLEVVTNAVKEVLEQLAAGELFTQWGLEENSLENLATPESDEDGSNAMAESFKAFTKAVATQILQSKGDTQSLPKKKRRKVLTEVQQMKDHIKEEIRHFIRFRKNCVENQGNEHLMAEQHQESHMKGQERPDQLDVDDDNSEDSGSSKLKKKFKKSKKEKSSKQKKSKSSQKDVRADESEIQQQHESKVIESVEPAENDDQPPAQHSYFYQQFEEEKNRVLSRVPDNVKKRFRQIAFTKWNKVYLPVLEISPYDVEPGAVRDQWMTMFEKTKRENRSPTRLIFWYGTTWEDRSEAYSFLPKNKLKGVEEALDLGMGKLPKTIQKKVDGGKSLTGAESFHVKALQQFDLDKDLPPEDRIKWMMQFEEDWVYQERYLVNQNENGAVPQELDDLPPSTQSAESFENNTLPEPEPEPEPEKNIPSPTIEESKPSVPKKKHKKDKKTKQEHIEFQDYVKEDYEDSVESEDKDNDDDYTETSTKSKKRKRNSTKNDKGKSGKKKKRKETKETEEIPKRKKKIGRSSDDEKSTHSEKDERSTHSEKSDKKRGKKRKSKETRVKSSKDKKVKQSLDTDPESSSQSNDKSHQEEQHRFEECEKVILPIISLMEKAISKNDAKIAEQSLKQLKSKASVITAPFIEHYKPQNSVKSLRNLMKENNPKIGTLGKEVFNELKVVYSDKKSNIPQGFKPRATVVKKESKTKNETLELEKKHAEVTPSPKNQEEHHSHSSQNIPLQSQTKSKEKNAVKSDSIDTSSSSQGVKKKSVAPVPRAEDSSASTPVSQDMPLKDNASLTKANGSSHHNESHNHKSIPKRSTPTPSSLPPPRKAFSLRGMLDGSKPTPTPKAKDNSHKDSNTTSLNGNKTPSRQTPEQFQKWSISSDSIPPTDPDRLFAIDFLSEAVSTSFGTFPPFITNEASLVQSLEEATHTWSSTRKRALDDYWGKIHDLTAAIAGKNGKGTLVKLINEGRYKSPMDVVKLNRMNLHNAFKGRSID